MSSKGDSMSCVSAHVLGRIQGVPYYLLIRRCSPYLFGTWQMVSGKVEEGETAWQAALREIWEETGLRPDHFYSADAVETFYMKDCDQVMHCPVFVAMVTNPGPVKLCPREHDAFAWVDLDEALQRLVWSEQKRVLSHIHREFVLKEPNPLLLIQSNKKKSDDRAYNP